MSQNEYPTDNWWSLCPHSRHLNGNVATDGQWLLLRKCVSKFCYSERQEWAVNAIFLELSDVIMGSERPFAAT
jgi:hypothetical protein